MNNVIIKGNEKLGVCENDNFVKKSWVKPLQIDKKVDILNNNKIVIE